MDKTFFVHIGAHKTGTSAIQHALGQLNELEDNGGFYYWELFPFWPRGIDKPTNERFIENIHYLKEPNIIASYEGFCGDLFSAYSDVETLANNLRLVTQGVNTRIILYTRNQSDLWNAMCAQHVMEGGTMTPSDFKKKEIFPKSFNWLKVLNAYVDRFGAGNIDFVDYDVHKEDIFTPFCNIVGIPKKVKEAIRVERVNEPIPKEALEFLRFCNDGFEYKDDLRYFLQEKYSGKKLGERKRKVFIDKGVYANWVKKEDLKSMTPVQFGL